ncbi:MAG: tetratricopeptide repeat protein, partial [Casimicrobiaceae bacterium]
ERLNEAGEGDAVRTAHLAHYVVLAEKAGPDLNGARWSEWFDTFRHEQENVLAAHAWCPNAVEGGELALRLAGSSWRYWSNTAQADRGFGLAEAALALADAEADSPSLCRTLHGRAAHALRLGRYDVVGASAERALRMARRIGDVGLIIDALGDVATGFLVTGRESEGLAIFTEASILARSASDEARLGSIMGGLGEVHRSRGDVVAAEQAYREALRLSRSCHDQRVTGVTLANLSRLLIATDRPAEAKTLLGECMSLQHTRANKEMVHCSLDVAAALASALGDHPTAARFHGAMERTGHESRTCREPVDEAFFAPRIARSRAALGEAAFDAATAAGWALGYDAATAELGHWLARGDAAGGTLAA